MNGYRQALMNKNYTSVELNSPNLTNFNKRQISQNEWKNKFSDQHNSVTRKKTFKSLNRESSK